MKLKTYLVACISALLLTLSSCDQPTEDLREIDLNREDKIIVIRVVVHDDVEDLGAEDGVVGYAAWNVYPKSEPDDPNYFCKIYVVRPKSTKDKAQMKTWGHELMHCVYGTWHSQSEEASNVPG